MSEFTMEDYSDYPFAMEIVNGEIISLTKKMQQKIRKALTEKLDISNIKLKKYLVALSEFEDPEDDTFAPIEEFDFDTLAEILGFDLDDGRFSGEGIGFLESSYGWEAKELLEFLGFQLEEDIVEMPHGHGNYGVIYYEQT